MKIKSFSEILNKTSKKGGAKDCRPSPLYAYGVKGGFIFYARVDMLLGIRRGCEKKEN